MHAKMNRRKLDKLNIIKICEEILNPSVPMALRLSGILMGGVVIIYERKVKLLYDDVTRLMVELNEAWKVKAGAGSHSTDLPKRKSQAKYEAVTLPDNEEGDAPEIERFLNFSNTATTVMGLQPQGAYICVCLDNVDETYITGNTGGEDVLQDNHQGFLFTFYLLSSCELVQLTLIISLYGNLLIRIRLILISIIVMKGSRKMGRSS